MRLVSVGEKYTTVEAVIKTTNKAIYDNTGKLIFTLISEPDFVSLILPVTSGLEVLRYLIFGFNLN